MRSKEEKSQQLVHLKSCALALLVGVLEGIFAGLTTSATRFSWPEFAFAFILTYTIALGFFSKSRAT